MTTQMSYEYDKHLQEFNRLKKLENGLRNQFAAIAMDKLLTEYPSCTAEFLSGNSVKYADALIAELEK